MTNTQRHIDELYKTGKTTFRDDQLVHKDYVVSFGDLVSKWAISNTNIIGMAIKAGLATRMRVSFKKYAINELKQLCIDYYGDE